MKKKITKGVLLLTGLLLSACQTPDYAATPITVWADKDEKDVLTTIVQSYNETVKDVKERINVNFVTKTLSEALDFPKAEESKRPALISIDDAEVPSLAENGDLAPLSAYRRSAVQQNDLPVAYTGASNGSACYGFPSEANFGYFLYYDSAVLKEDEVKDLGALLARLKVLGRALQFDVTNAWYGAALPLSEGIGGASSISFTVTNNQVSYQTSWDSAVTSGAFEAMNALLEPYYQDNTLWAGNKTRDVLAGYFRPGGLAAAISGTWMANSLTELVPTIKAAPLPAFTYGGASHHLASFTGTTLYGVNAKSSEKEKEVAFKLGELLTSKEAQITRAKAYLSVPTNNAAVKDDALKDNDVALALHQQNLYGVCQSRVVEDHYWAVGKKIFASLIDSSVKGSQSWTEFLKSECDALRAKTAVTSY